MTRGTAERLVRRVWSELERDPAELDALDPLPTAPLPARLDVSGLAVGSVAAASLAAGSSTGLGRRVCRIHLDGDRIAVAFTSERWFLQDGVRPEVWAPLSGFWRATDGWVRTHGNYPHHAAALRRTLGVPADADAAAIGEAILAWHAQRARVRGHGGGRALRRGAPRGSCGRRRPDRATVDRRPADRRGVCQTMAEAEFGCRVSGSARGRASTRSHSRDRRAGRDPHPRAARCRRASHRSTRTGGTETSASRHRSREALGDPRCASGRRCVAVQHAARKRRRRRARLSAGVARAACARSRIARGPASGTRDRPTRSVGFRRRPGATCRVRQPGAGRERYRIGRGLASIIRVYCRHRRSIIRPDTCSLRRWCRFSTDSAATADRGSRGCRCVAPPPNS